MDEAVQLILPTLYLPIDVPPHVLSSRLTSSERLRVVERVIKRINDRTPVAYLTNKAWFCGLEFSLTREYWFRVRRSVS